MNSNSNDRNIAKDMSQGQSGDGYASMIQSDSDQVMGGGVGAMGSGVAGGHDGQTQQQTQGSTEKADWLDKGIESIGQKVGFNVSNADKAGDFANKEFKQYEGRGLPGVN